LTFLVTALDGDEPAQTLTFTLDPGAPSGASIDSVSGLFAWTPSEEQGPSTNLVAIRVTDNGSPSANALTYVTIFVTEVNKSPVMDPIGDHTIEAGAPFTFAVHGTDPDLPAQLLTYHLAAGSPAGCSINPSNGVLTWTPSEDQGLSTNILTVFLTDNGSPALSAAETFTIIVTNKMNTAPSLSAISSKTVHQGGTVRFSASASDSDLPQKLSFSLEPGAPSGASINLTNGLFTWTANTSPGNNLVTVRVVDDGSPPLADLQTFSITVVDPLRIASITVLPAGSAVLTWNSIPDQRYRIEYKDTVDAPQWLPLGSEVVASTTSTSAVDGNQPSFTRIYRILLN
jgi:hypothetical protein